MTVSKPNVGVWIIGDQVYRDATSLHGLVKGTPIVFVESKKFCVRRPYHWQKLVLILSAMRHFAQELREAGHDVHYFELADDFIAALRQFVKQTKIDVLRLMEFNDHDRHLAVPVIEREIGCRIEVTPNNQFLCSRDEFDDWTLARRSLVMEFFYRDMRKRTGALMEPDGSPIGGKWNLDKLNRLGRIPKELKIPEPAGFAPDDVTQRTIADVHRHFAQHCFGGKDLSAAEMMQRFRWPVTPDQARQQLDAFIATKLEHFGPYEDAMTTRSWSLWHSHLSVALNCGLIHPREILDRTLEAAMPRLRSGTLPLNSVEGFVRQLIGWREFMHGIYWHEMTKTGVTPYTQRNELKADNPLPDFYWTGDTEMACFRDSLRPVIDVGFSHHISRLMVLANFSLLHGISPQMVNEWFIYAYADGYEWVTTPNVVGMALYADGGIVATKPYAAGGAYINKMSDYCAGCRYNPAKATGPDACPFTRAYWPFIAKHRKRLGANMRTRFSVLGLDRLAKPEVARRSKETNAWLESQKPWNAKEY